MQNKVIFEIDLFSFPWSSNNAALPEHSPRCGNCFLPETKSPARSCSGYLVTRRSHGYKYYFPIILIKGSVIMQRPARLLTLRTAVTSTQILFFRVIEQLGRPTCKLSSEGSGPKAASDPSEALTQEAQAHDVASIPPAPEILFVIKHP